MAKGMIEYQLRRWSSRLIKIVLASLLISGGVQGILQYFAWDLMGKNLSSLLVEVGTIGEAGFRRHYVEACALSGVEIDPADITITLDDRGMYYSGSVPYEASFDFLFVEFHPTWEVTGTAVRLPDENDP